MTSPMTSPTSRFSQLSLQGMPPTLRSHSQQQSSEAGRAPDDDDDSEPGNHSQEDEDEEEDDEDDGPVRSPTTNLSYSVENLDEETEEMVRDLFRPPAQEETPQIVLEWCGFSTDPDVYAFQLHEVVPRTIRLGSRTSRIPTPSCNCMEERRSSRPCRHLVWLMDQLTRQTVPDADTAGRGGDGDGDGDGDDEVPLELDARGFPVVLGEPYDRIADFHVDVLADALHCDFGPPSLHPHAEPNPHRVREVRELLASLARPSSSSSSSPTPPEAYAPALFDHPPLLRTPDLLTRGDLEATLLRLLLSNNDLFALFLKLLSPADPARDPYRKLQQRCARVLADLSASPTSPSRGAGASVEGPRNVAWAATHLLRAVAAVEGLVGRAGGVPAWERAAAARALVWLLKTVANEYNRDAHAGATQDDRNLYQRLVGNARAGPGGGGGFVVDVLLRLPEQNQYIDELEAVRERVQVCGYQEAFMRKLDLVIANLRRRSSVGGAAAAGGGGPGSMAGPSREGRGGAGRGSGGGAASGSGSGSGAGSKRTGSERERDRKAKRAR